MTLRSLTIVIACCTMCACNHMNSGDHLPRQKMEDIMYDLSLAEAYSTKTPDNIAFGGLKNMDSLAGYYKDVLDHYHVTKDEFQKSLEWYKQQPNEIDSIYTHLSARADKVNNEEMKKKRDNLQPNPNIPPVNNQPPVPRADSNKRPSLRRLPQSIAKPQQH